MNIYRDGAGKPSIDGMEFSVSHSGSIALFAFASVAVGIDVESSLRSVQALAIAERYFQASEVECLRGLNDVERQSLFIRMWVAKEAAVKLSGAGIARGLSDVECDFTMSAPRVFHRGRLVHLYEFSVGEHHRAALASWEPLCVNFFSLP